MKRVFIANRGEIAVRIVHACEKLNLETVLGASDVDRDSMAAQLADRVVVIGPGPASQSYLRDAIVVQAALSTGCDAIHPGYGFLSENPALARRAAENGITFVGPPAETIELAGDKLRARQEAERAGVPILEGRQIASADDADGLPYPLLIKAAGGGGGRGIKLAHDHTELGALLGLARSEAGSAFGDDRLYVEHAVQNARHVEVQLAADTHGNVIHLGERDCTIQRRYQKVIEEAPAPTLTDKTRAGLHEAALSFAEAIDYTNLGTAEFILDADTEEFFFLEMNCRIQVEHPVTEALTGRDLVALQLQIAGREPLDLSQEDVELTGHAVEARLNAEDVAHGFRPSPGTLSLFSIPRKPGLRVDTHCRPGASVPPFYDSLLAKLIAHGPDRNAAIDNLIDALEDTDVEGVETNRTLLISALDHPGFRSASTTTDWLMKVLA